MATTRKRNPNPRLVKIHRSYTVEEAAGLLGVHRHTVRNWINGDLPVIDRKRPILILGTDLRAFLERKRKKAKCPCPPGYLYCVKCRAARKPASAMVDYLPMTETGGNLRGICPDCETLMHRRVSVARLAEVCADIDIVFREASVRIVEGAFPSPNCAIDDGGENHENTLR